MSFIAGYLMGLDEGGLTPTYIDSRIEKLTDNSVYPPMRVCGVADGWNIRIKIASDIDNAQYFRFGSTHGGIVDYITMWTLYYCVYLNDEFKYAACQNPFYMKYQENYQNADVPNRLYSVQRNSGFQITSAEPAFGSGGTFLNIKLEGTYIHSVTAYSWTNDADRIEGETTDTMQMFSASKYDFHGSQDNGCYIVNGNGDDFKNYVHGLYAACRIRASANAAAT